MPVHLTGGMGADVGAVVSAGVDTAIYEPDVETEEDVPDTTTEDLKPKISNRERCMR